MCKHELSSISDGGAKCILCHEFFTFGELLKFAEIGMQCGNEVQEEEHVDPYAEKLEQDAAAEAIEESRSWRCVE